MRQKKQSWEDCAFLLELSDRDEPSAAAVIQESFTSRNR